MHRTDGVIDTVAHPRIKKYFDNGELVRETEFLSDDSHLERHYEAGRLLCELYYSRLSVRMATLFLLKPM